MYTMRMYSNKLTPRHDLRAIKQYNLYDVIKLRIIRLSWFKIFTETRTQYMRKVLVVQVLMRKSRATKDEICTHFRDTNMSDSFYLNTLASFLNSKLGACFFRDVLAQNSENYTKIDLFFTYACL